MPWSMWTFVELDCLLMPPDDDTKLNSFLESIDSEVKASGMRSLRKSQREPESNLRRFVRLNWMSVLLLSQALLIIVLFGSLIAYPTLLAAVSYFILLLLRWLNYPLVVSALFHDENKWLAVIAGILYTLCSLTGRLWTIQLEAVSVGLRRSEIDGHFESRHL